jgi:ribosomal protein L20A (L18A)
MGFIVKESVNEAIKVRNGETPMEGKWGVYDISTGNAIKEVGNARAATRLMNRLMNSGQYKEVAAKWVGEAKSKAMITIGSIIGKKQAQKIDGVLVDMQTAHVIMKVWNALGSSNRKKFEKLRIGQMAKVAWKLMK